MNKNNALKYVQSNNLIGIKAGSERPDFLEIWIVTVRDRIFARSWGIAERSWYNTFLKDPAGKIKCGNHIYTIKAIIPDDIDQLTEEINQAYLAKYNSEHNRQYAIGIIKDKHVEKTMEFILREEE